MIRFGPRPVCDSAHQKNGCAGAYVGVTCLHRRTRTVSAHGRTRSRVTQRGQNQRTNVRQNLPALSRCGNASHGPAANDVCDSGRRDWRRLSAGHGHPERTSSRSDPPTTPNSTRDFGISAQCAKPLAIYIDRLGLGLSCTVKPNPYRGTRWVHPLRIDLTCATAHRTFTTTEVCAENCMRRKVWKLAVRRPAMAPSPSTSRGP